MAKKQSRRSISINRQLYEQAKTIAEGSGIPLAQLTENALRQHIATKKPAPSAPAAQPGSSS